MQNIGRNETSSTAGADRPTPCTATMKPSVAARLYAGATDAVPMTTFDTNEIALDLSPFSPGAEPRGSCLIASGCVAVATSVPSGRPVSPIVDGARECDLKFRQTPSRTAWTDLDQCRLAHPLADRRDLPGGLQLRADLPVPEDRRPNRRALDLRRLPGVAVLADRGRLRGRRASRGHARCAREPLRRRRA